MTRYLLILLCIASIANCTLLRKCKDGPLCIVDPQLPFEDEQHFHTLQNALDHCACPSNISHPYAYLIQCTPHPLPTPSLTFHLHPNHTLSYTFHHCTLTHPSQWKVLPHVKKEDSVEGVRRRRKKKYGHFGVDGGYGKEEREEKDVNEVIEGIYGRRRNAKPTIDFNFYNVSFEGLSTASPLFEGALVNSRVILRDCHVSGYIGRAFLELGYTEDRSHLSVQRTVFRNIRGYAVHAKGLQGYNLQNNTFYSCGGAIGGGHACVYLHTNYVAQQLQIILTGNTHHSAHGSRMMQNSTAFHLHHIPIDCATLDLRENRVEKGPHAYGLWLEDAEECVLPRIAQQTTVDTLYDEATVLRYLAELNVFHGNVHDTLYGRPEHASSLQVQSTLNNVVCDERCPQFEEEYCEVGHGMQYASIQQAVDECVYNLVYVHGDHIVSRLDLHRDDLRLISLDRSVIMGSGHKVRGTRITLRGFTLQNIGGAGDSPYFTVEENVGLLELANNRFVGLKVRAMGLVTGRMPEGVFRFRYNEVTGFFVKAVRIEACKAAHIIGNMFEGNEGSSLEIHDVSDSYCVQKNHFARCRGSTGALKSTSIVHIKAATTACMNRVCSFRDNVHNALDLRSINGVDDVVYYLQGGHIRPVDITGNASSGGAHGMVFEETENVTLDDYEVLESSNGMLRFSLSDDIGFLDGERYRSCSIPCMVESHVQHYCTVDRETAIYSPLHGYTHFTNLTFATRYCAPGKDIRLHQTLIRENLSIETDISVVGEVGVDGDVIRPVIYGRGHEVRDGVSVVSFTDVEFRYASSSNSVLQGDDRAELFRNIESFNSRLRHVSFRRVDFVGDKLMDSWTGRVDAFSLNLPRDAYVEIVGCTVRNWPSLSASAKRDVLSRKVIVGDIELPDDRVATGGRIWLRYMSGGRNMLNVRDNFFENIDGTALRVENVGSFNVSGNVFLNCGGRHAEHAAAVIIKANAHYEGGEYYFQHNHCNQTLPLLFPEGGGPLSAYYISSYWLSSFHSSARVWKFANNTARGHPIGTRFSTFAYDQVMRKAFDERTYIEMDVLSDLGNLDNCGINGIIHDFVLGLPSHDMHGFERTCSDSLNSTTFLSSCKCPVPPPSHCIVDKDNNMYTPYHPYYGRWLFSTLHDALHSCVDPQRIIEIKRTSSPYTERLLIPQNGWTITSPDGAEFLGSEHMISGSSTTLRGIHFLHLGDKATLSTAPQTCQSDIVISNVTFHGRYSKKAAIEGFFKNIKLLYSSFFDYQGQDVVSIQEKMHTTVLYSSFVNFKHSALTIRGSESYTVSNNQFSDASKDLHASTYGVYLNARKRVIFSHNTYTYPSEEDEYTQENPYTQRITKLNTGQKGSRTAFWIDHVPRLEYRQIEGNQVTAYVAIGIRLSSFEDRKSLKMQLHSLSNRYNNIGVHGMWHDLVEGRPDKDIDLEKYPINYQEQICDDGCETADYIIIASILSFVSLVLCLVCCCIGWGYQKPPHRLKMVYSNYLKKYIPADKKYWPLIQYGYLPGWGKSHVRPVPAYIGDPNVNRIVYQNQVVKEEMRHGRY